MGLIHGLEMSGPLDGHVRLVHDGVVLRYLHIVELTNLCKGYVCSIKLCMIGQIIRLKKNILKNDFCFRIWMESGQPICFIVIENLYKVK